MQLAEMWHKFAQIFFALVFGHFDGLTWPGKSTSSQHQEHRPLFPNFSIDFWFFDFWFLIPDFYSLNTEYWTQDWEWRIEDCFLFKMEMWLNAEWCGCWLFMFNIWPIFHQFSMQFHSLERRTVRQWLLPCRWCAFPSYSRMTVIC